MRDTSVTQKLFPKFKIRLSVLLHLKAPRRDKGMERREEGMKKGTGGDEKEERRKRGEEDRRRGS